jgi:hypothetical protein
MQALEILLLLVLVGYQISVFIKNQVLIRQVRAMYPNTSEISIEEDEAPDADTEALTLTEKLMTGAVSFKGLPEHANVELRVESEYPHEKEPYLRFEQWNDGWQPFTMVAVWKSVFINLIARGTIEQVDDLTPTVSYDSIVAKNPTPEFAEIVKDTNEYLANNKGAAADFNILKDVSERRAESLDERVQAQIATPLYAGLLGTFAGAMLGLYSLGSGSGATTAPVAGESSTFLGEEQILSFLGGVGIAMVGSFAGLLLTLWGNNLLKDARMQRNDLKNAYYTFLQKRLLPKLNTDMESSLSSLHGVLSSFKSDFFGKIQNDFFGQITKAIGDFKPLIGQLTQNITLQKEFLDRLDKIGYDKLASATIQVFNRVDESASHFDKFLGYQQILNQTLQRGTDASKLLTTLLDRLTSLEEFAVQFPEEMHKREQAIAAHIKFFGDHTNALDRMKAGLEQEMNKGANALVEIIQFRTAEMEEERQAAGQRLKDYFASLNNDNIYDRVVRHLDDHLKKSEAKAAAQTTRLTDTLQRLETRLTADENQYARLAAGLERLAQVQERIAGVGLWGRLFGKQVGTNGHHQ